MDRRRSSLVALFMNLVFDSGRGQGRGADGLSVSQNAVVTVSEGRLRNGVFEGFFGFAWKLTEHLGWSTS